MAMRISRILGLVFLSLILVAAGTVACKKAEETVPQEEEGMQLKEGQLEFEGAVKLAVGKYIFIPKVRGFDLVLQGGLTSGTVSDLMGKEVKGVGEFNPERPSILVIKELQIKDEAGAWAPIFTQSEEVVLEDFISMSDRESYVKFENLSYNKAEDWEGKETARIYGQIEGEEGAYKIMVFDDKGKEAGQILVDNVTDYARYYMAKLRLFNKFWFYFKVQETVDWSTRRRTRDLFHADLVFAGLF